MTNETDPHQPPPRQPATAEVRHRAAARLDTSLERRWPSVARTALAGFAAVGLLATGAVSVHSMTGGDPSDGSLPVSPANHPSEGPSEHPSEGPSDSGTPSVRSEPSRGESETWANRPLTDDEQARDQKRCLAGLPAGDTPPDDPTAELALAMSPVLLGQAAAPGKEQRLLILEGDGVRVVCVNGTWDQWGPVGTKGKQSPVNEPSEAAPVSVFPDVVLGSGGGCGDEIELGYVVRLRPEVVSATVKLATGGEEQQSERVEISGGTAMIPVRVAKGAYGKDSDLTVTFRDAKGERVKVNDNDTGDNPAEALTRGLWLKHGEMC